MLKATIIGNLGSDAELKYGQNGTAFLRANVASNYRVRNASGEWEDRTEWVRMTLFGNRAEALDGRLTKGMRIYAEGRLEARPWTDSQGTLRAGLEMTALDIEFMGGRPDGESQPQQRSARRDELDDSDLPF